MSYHERVRLELLYWDGCPSHPKALAELRAAMTDLALDPSEVIVREVKTQAEAELEHFVGSPTVRVDGVDVQPPGEEPAGLTCRVYHRRDGRISPTPDPADVRDALRSAQAPTGGKR
jgi:hypothetical protein